MEIIITRFYNEACPRDYSASVAEIGNDAGPVTWQAANDDADEYSILDTDEKREAFRQHIKGCGFGSAAEITALSDKELNALCIQAISGDIRESCLSDDPDDWEEYERESEAGQVSGRLFQGVDGEIYYYLGE